MTDVYHITHIDNLPRIIRANGLWCDAERIRQGFNSVGIAHQQLKDRRARTPVLVGAQGTLGDYVPYYFANRSPMLYSIHKGFVQSYDGGQEDIVYLVSSVEQVAQGDQGWCFTNGHPVEAMTDFYADLTNLDKVDWHLIGHWSWRNTDADPDRKRRKQAEFLVHKSVPWSWFHTIGVMNRKVVYRVQQILGDAGVEHRPRISIKRKWYYD